MEKSSNYSNSAYLANSVSQSSYITNQAAEDRKVISNFIDLNFPIFEKSKKQYKAEDLTANAKSDSKSWSFKKIAKVICRIIGLIYLKNLLSKFNHKDSKILTKEKIHCLKQTCIDIKKIAYEIETKFSRTTTFLDAMDQLRELATIDEMVNDNKKDFIQFLGADQFNELNELLSALFAKGKEKAVKNFEAERQQEYIQKEGIENIQKFTSECEELEKKAQELQSKIHQSSTYREAIPLLKELKEIKQKIIKGNAPDNFSTEIFKKYVSDIKAIHKESKNHFIDKALASDIQRAVDNQHIPADSKIEKMKNAPQIRERFKAVHQLRIEKLENKDKKSGQAHLLDRKVAKAQFAAALGVKPKISPKGVNGAQFLKGVATDGKKKTNEKEVHTNLGVFKGPNPESTGRIRNWLHYLGLSQRSVLHGGKYIEVVSEKAAYIIAKKLNTPLLNLAPVRIIKYQDQTGAFLAWQKGDLACKVSAQINARKGYTQDEKNRFQMFAAYDFLLGNLDRHEDNWMIQLNEKGEIRKIVPIDNANILPKKEIRSWNLYGNWNQYAWSSWKIANEEFSPEVKKILSELDDNFVDQICEEINQDKEISDLVNKQMADEPDCAQYPSPEAKDLMKKRFALLKKVAAGEIKTPQALAKA